MDVVEQPLPGAPHQLRAARQLPGHRPGLPARNPRPRPVPPGARRCSPLLVGFVLTFSGAHGHDRRGRVGAGRVVRHGAAAPLAVAHRDLPAHGRHPRHPRPGGGPHLLALRAARRLPPRHRRLAARHRHLRGAVVPADAAARLGGAVRRGVRRAARAAGAVVALAARGRHRGDRGRAGPGVVRRLLPVVAVLQDPHRDGVRRQRAHRRQQHAAADHRVGRAGHQGLAVLPVPLHVRRASRSTCSSSAPARATTSRSR